MKNRNEIHADIHAGFVRVFIGNDRRGFVISPHNHVSYPEEVKRFADAVVEAWNARFEWDARDHNWIAD